MAANEYGATQATLSSSLRHARTRFDGRVALTKFADDSHKSARRIRLWKFSIPLPQSRIARLIAGIALIIGGMLWFLPVLGWWMLPLGLLILSSDYPRIRRLKRKGMVWLCRRIKPKRQLPKQ